MIIINDGGGQYSPHPLEQDTGECVQFEVAGFGHCCDNYK